MGEAILAKYGIGSSGGGYDGNGTEMPSEGLICYNAIYEVSKSGNYRVLCVGGGQGGGSGWMDYTEDPDQYPEETWTVRSGKGGNSGFFNAGNFYLNQGDLIPISIGSGGAGGSGNNGSGSNGGLTSFGTYISSGSNTSNKNNGNSGSLYWDDWGWRNVVGPYAGGSGGILYLASNGLAILKNSATGAVALGYGDGGTGASAGWNNLSTGYTGVGGCIYIKYLD